MATPTGETIDITPIIANESYSPHTQNIKAVTQELSRLVAMVENEPDTSERLVAYVMSHIGILREAVSDLLGDEFILMLQNHRRPGKSFIDTLETKPIKVDFD